jgi:hypothetical protein
MVLSKYQCFIEEIISIKGIWDSARILPFGNLANKVIRFQSGG